MSIRFWIIMSCLGLFFLNLVFFTLKSVQTLSSISQRTPQVAEHFIKKHIPVGSKVIGEPMFYYAVIQSGSDYQYMDLYNTLEKREEIHRLTYDYDYMIATAHHLWRKPHIIAYYQSQATLVLVDSLVLPQNDFNKWVSNLKLGSISLISDVEHKGYSCYLYKRVK